MPIRTSPFAARLGGLLLCLLVAGAAPAARDYEFHHENVLGTSLELCVRAHTEDAARAAEARVLAEIDRLADDTDLIDTVSHHPSAGEVLRHLGRQGRPRQAARPGYLHTLHRGGAGARDLPDHPQGHHHRPQAVYRGPQGQCRDQVRHNRLSPQGHGTRAHRRAGTLSRFGRSAAGSPCEPLRCCAGFQIPRPSG